MNYLWQKFNIKTFPSETVVFLDGVFMPELSTLSSSIIDKKYENPIHIIYVGETPTDKNLEIEILVPDVKAFLTVKIENKKPAFLNILLKNTGKNSFIKARVFVQNYSNFELSFDCNHLSKNTKIEVDTKIVARGGSFSKLFAAANIGKDCVNCESDIKFSAMIEKDAKINFIPAQYINSVPITATHAAFIYRGTQHQIEYLRESGLSEAQIKTILEDVFINDAGEDAHSGADAHSDSF